LADGLLGGGLIPRHQLAERDMLLAYLQRQRELVHWKLAGLSDEAARTTATPSGMSIAGLVRHLTNVERSWFRRHLDGQQGLEFDWSDEDPDGDMRAGERLSLAQLLADYRDECARCDEVIARHELDEPSAVRDHTLRWILMHLVEETARHVGHLDLLRELADGVVGEEPEGAPPPGVDAE
jgi:uncharacterized damage-inducible protein DinB